MKLSDIFNKEVGKAALVGMGATAVAAAVLPVVAVSAPVVAVGGALGALIGISNKNQGPSR